MATNATTGAYPAVVTIVDLPTGTTLTGAELLEAVQTVGGIANSIKVSIAQMVASSLGGLPVGGATGQLLTKASGTSYATQWASISSLVTASTGIAIAGSTTVQVSLATIAGLSVLGVAGTTTVVPAAITANSSAQVLQTNAGGTGLGWGVLTTAMLPSGATSLPLVANGAGAAPNYAVLTVPGGGIGTTTLTAHGVLLGEGTAALGIAAAGTTGTLFVSNGTASDPSFQSLSSLVVATHVATGGLTVLGIGTTGGSISTGTVTFSNVRYPAVKTALYTAVENDLGGVVAFSTAALATFVVPQATTVVGQNFAPGWFTDVVNFGGTTIVVAPQTSNLTGIGATTGLGPNQSMRVISDGTNYQAFGLCGPLALSRTNTAQSFSGGIRIVSFNLGAFTTGTLTLDSGKGPLQIATNSGAFTIAPPANDGEIDLLVINATSAGAITFSGFSVGANTGDAYTTTNTQKFILMSRTINGSATYKWAALQ